MSKRSLIIFGAALVFAARTAIHPDPVSLAATVIFLAANCLDIFFGTETVDSKALKRVEEIEHKLNDVKSDLTSVKLAQGMRGGR